MENIIKNIRITAEAGLKVSPEIISICRDMDLSELPYEFMMEETEKALLEFKKPSLFFEELRRIKLLDVWFPELKNLIGVPQNKIYHQEGDTWTHTMMVIDEASKRRKLVKYPSGFMLSALCHDFGKAVSTTEHNGIVHSYNHEIDGLPLVSRFMKRLSGKDKNSRLIKYVLNMTELHMQPNLMAEAKSRLKSTNKLFDSAIEPFDLIQLSICDGLGKIPKKEHTEEFLMQRYKKFQSIMSRPYVTEDDIINAGINNPDAMPEILHYAHKLRLAGCDKDNSLRQCISYARKVLKI